MAENIDTAIAEVRPVKGGKVCVSKVALKKAVKLLDLSAPRRRASVTLVSEDDHQEWFSYLTFLENLALELSSSILPEKSELEYIPTQFLCEFIKSIPKYDGLIFKSSFDKGKNIVLFDPSIARISKPKHYAITATNYGYSEIKP